VVGLCYILLRIIRNSFQVVVTKKLRDLYDLITQRHCGEKPRDMSQGCGIVGRTPCSLVTMHLEVAGEHTVYPFIKEG